MNERIKELVLQAVKDVDIVTGNELLDDELAKMYIPDCFAEKFAELMIKEFIDVVENLAPMYDDYRDQIEDRFRRDCISQVKHRFIWSDKE
jgi:hypothetical protein